MQGFYDIYFIKRHRDRDFIQTFLDRFLPDRAQKAVEYYIPPFAQTPDLIFNDSQELIDFCFEKHLTDNSIYWRSLHSKKPEHAMVFFLKDDSVVYGVSVNTDDAGLTQRIFNDMAEFFDSELGYVAWDSPPEVESFEEFKQQVVQYQHAPSWH